MCADRDASFGEPLDLWRHLESSLKFDRGDLCLLHEAGGSEVGLLRGGSVGADRQVADDQCALDALGDRPGKRDQLVDSHWEGRRVAVDVVGGRVTDQDGVDAGFVEDLGRVRVV